MSWVKKHIGLLIGGSVVGCIAVFLIYAWAIVKF
jgi:putative effector of murein hydrolase LrgA (UPF0299 family)